MLDSIDVKILEMLEDDGRESFTQIARKLKVTEATIRKRISTLQKEGVIKKFTIKIDPSKLGLNTVAIIGVDIEPMKLLAVAQKLCNFKEAKCVATSTGDHMVMIEVWTKNGRELANLISERIETIEGVKKICPALVLERLKG
jgi:Lrp/AsnC family transcriptional regulator for asnA, asnC and gidA